LQRSFGKLGASAPELALFRKGAAAEDKLEQVKELKTISCPCCGEAEVVEGTFSNRSGYQSPLPAEMSGTRQDALADWLRHANDRFYCQMECPLPLARVDSPIIVTAWVEISRDTATMLIDAEGDHCITGSGHLASDIPGFEGSIAASVKFVKMGEHTANIVECNDNRLDLNANLDHTEMLALYRRTWGNPNPLVAADPALRKTIFEHYQTVFERKFIRRDTPVPDPLVGSPATEIALAPPMDSWDEVIVGTIGYSEPETTNLPPLEVVASFNNPSEELLDVFGQFGYISRSFRPEYPFLGALVHEQKLIPGSKQISTWVLGPVQKISDEEAIVRAEEEDSALMLIQAYPIYQSEIQLAANIGVRRLVKRIVEECDVSDLNRAELEPEADTEEI